MEDKNYGYVKIKLAKLIKDRKISKNKLSHRAEMQRSQINHYCNEEITRLDTRSLIRFLTTYIPILHFLHYIYTGIKA